jgi:hypothetical protein
VELDRTSAGKVVIRFRALVGLSLALSFAVPLLITGILFISVGVGEKGAPALVYAGFAGLGCIGVVMALGTRASSRVTVTIDRQSSTLAIESRSNRAVLPLREIASAEIGTAVDLSGPQASHRLEILRRDGGRVPATSSFYNLYLLSDLADVQKAINAELGKGAG